MVVENRRLALAGREQFQHAANIRSGTAAGELAVAERAGPPFPEQIIAFRIERSAGIEGMYIANPVSYGATSLEHQRPITLFGQEIGRHQSGRSGTDHHRALVQRRVARLRHFESRLLVSFDSFRALISSGARNDGRLVGRHDRFGRVDEMHVGFVSRVETLAEDPPPRNIAWADVHCPGQPLGQTLFRLFDAEANIGQANGHTRTDGPGAAARSTANVPLVCQCRWGGKKGRPLRAALRDRLALGAANTADDSYDIILAGRATVHPPSSAVAGGEQCRCRIVGARCKRQSKSLHPPHHGPCDTHAA